MAALFHTSKKQLILTGIPGPVLNDDTFTGGILSIRHVNLWISNGAATLGIGAGLQSGGFPGITLTMTNAYLLQPNQVQSFDGVLNMVVGASNNSQAAIYAICASTSSGARASFMWTSLGDNLIA